MEKLVSRIPPAPRLPKVDGVSLIAPGVEALPEPEAPHVATASEAPRWRQRELQRSESILQASGAVIAAVLVVAGGAYTVDAVSASRLEAEISARIAPGAPGTAPPSVMTGGPFSRWSDSDTLSSVSIRAEDVERPGLGPVAVEAEATIVREPFRRRETPRSSAKRRAREARSNPGDTPARRAISPGCGVRSRFGGNAESRSEFLAR